MKLSASTWDDLFPAYPMEYQFLSALFARLYQQERVQLQLLAALSGLAIFIAFLGLFGLVAYALRTHVKEMAVRRVLGAQWLSLVSLMGREYLSMLLLGAGLATPLSYWAVDQWLTGCAYRVDISLGWYGITFASIGLLLLVVVGWYV